VVRVSDITGLSRYRNKRNALLSQEGSTIETAVEIVRGVVPEPHSLRRHSETFRLGNHPSRHRKERDDAALLTQEGISPASASPYSCSQNLFWTAVVTDRDHSRCPKPSEGKSTRKVETRQHRFTEINAQRILAN
jgi:hypothetical protein